MHVDHIGGAGAILRQHPGIDIVAEDGVTRFLSEQSDGTRPVTTTAFKNKITLTLGSMKAHMQVGYWHSPPGDLFIYFPRKKVLMAVDMMSSGLVPYMGLDLTMNMDAYIGVFDQLLRYDFDILVPGHHSNPSTRDDVRLVKVIQLCVRAKGSPARWCGMPVCEFSSEIVPSRPLMESTSAADTRSFGALNGRQMNANVPVISAPPRPYDSSGTNQPAEHLP